MPIMPATSLYEVVLAIHVIAVVIAFGVTFAYPVMFTVGARHDPRALPLLHRIEYTIERTLINPGLLLVVAAGIFLASDGHHWSEFFVQWGLGAAVVIGALVGAVMIPSAKRAEEIAARDIAAGDGTEITLSQEYRALAQRLTVTGSLLSLLVLITIVFMVLNVNP
jgi:hypothetical protein